MIKQGFSYCDNNDENKPGPGWQANAYFFIQGKVVYRADKESDLINLRNGDISAWNSVTPYIFGYIFDSTIEKISSEKKLNTMIRYNHLSDGIKDKIISPYYTYIHLSRFDKLRLAWSWRNTLIHKKEFWMWLINISVAILAIFVSYLAIKLEFFS